MRLFTQALFHAIFPTLHHPVRPNIPPYAIWLYWISPFAWGVRGVCINELMSRKWDIPLDHDPSSTVGELALTSFGFYTERYWIWAGVGYM